MKLTEAQIARVNSLEDADGRITPRQVLEDAKNKRSPLHSLFNWDRNVAAEAHWLDVCREVIASVRVVSITQTASIKTPRYVRDPDAIHQGYRAVEALRAEPDKARESLIYTLEHAAGHLRRAIDLAGPLGLIAELDQLLERIVGVQRNLSQAA